MKKGSPVILSNASHVQYYREQAGFAVTMLEAKAKAAPSAEAPKEAESDGGTYTVAELKKLKKAQLAEIAESMDLEFDGASVADLIEGILEAQEEEDGSDED